MVAKRIFPALAAAGFAAAQSSTCTIQSQATIAASADVPDCPVWKGNVKVTGAGTIDLGSVEEIQGDLIIQSNPNLTSISAGSLKKVSGKVSLTDVQILSSVSMADLAEVGTLEVTAAPQLGALSLSLTKADTITVVDTFLNTLEGLDVSSLKGLAIKSNKRITKIESSLKTIDGSIQIHANGKDVSASFPNLVWAKELDIANVTTWSAPSLEVVNATMTFASNYFTSFEAANLTKTTSGDIYFIDNSQMKNLSFPILANLGGALVVANNTAIEKIDGFPELKDVEGSIKFRGSFNEFSLNKDIVVKGTTDISSTQDIEASCEAISGYRGFQKTPQCTSNNATANSDTSAAGGQGSSSNKDGDSSAAGLALNMALTAGAVLGASVLLW